MFVLVQDAPKAITSMDVQVGDPMGVGDRFGRRGEWSGVRDALMRPVPVVEDLELAQGVHQVSLVEDPTPETLGNWAESVVRSPRPLLWVLSARHGRGSAVECRFGWARFSWPHSVGRPEFG